VVSVGGGGGAAVGGAKNTFLVDSAGNIDYPQIGKLHLAGLSVREAKDLITVKLKDYLYQPAVEVRIMNFRVTMFGEVSAQGQLMSSMSRLTIVDAIAAAGGIPITGRRDNVKIIRDGGRITGFVDLNSKNVFNSPFYYLKQNDIIYVEPSRVRRQEANEFLRFYLPTITSLIATGLSLYFISTTTR
jgi:polysaccharide export outer membrane protein